MWAVDYIPPLQLEGCAYGSEDRANREAFEYHAFSMIIIISVAFILLFHPNLHRMYAPLARIVDSTILLQIVSDVSYFAGYPYDVDTGNCVDIYLSRVLIGVVIFGELHQLYLLANLLGLGNRSFAVLGNIFTIKSLLQLITLLMFLSIGVSLVIRRFKIVRNVWLILTSVLQVYFIALSKRSEESSLTNRVVDGSDRSVAIYRKVALLQIFPTSVNFIKRYLRLYGIQVLGRFGAVSQCLDEVCTLLFFVKSLIIAESSNVTVEVV